MSLWCSREVIVCLILVVTCGLNYGYNFTIITPYVNAMFSKMEQNEEFNEQLMRGILSSTLILGAMIGAFITALITTKFGRKRPILLMGLLSVIFAGISALASIDALGFIWLAVFRTLLGVSVGFLSTAVPTLVAELAPTAIRGRLNTLMQIFITIGILIAYGVGALVALGNDIEYINLLIGVIPMLPCLICAKMIPESPVWLEERPGAVTGANGKGSLESVEHTGDQTDGSVTREAPSVTVGIGDSSVADGGHVVDKLIPAKTVTWGEIVRDYSKCFWLGVILGVCQQITGINAVILYSTTIFQGIAGDGEDVDLIVGVVVSTWNFLTTLIGVALVDRAGRKPLLFYGFIIMVVGTLFLWIGDWALATYADPVNADGSLNKKYSLPVMITGVAIYLLGFEIGPGPVFFVLVSELFPAEIKNRLIALVNVILWIVNLAVVLLFPMLNSAIGGWVWFIFMIFSAVAAVAIHFLAVETKNIPLKDIRKQVYLPKKPKGEVAAPPADTIPAEKSSSTEP